MRVVNLAEDGVNHFLFGRQAGVVLAVVFDFGEAVPGVQDFAQFVEQLVGVGLGVFQQPQPLAGQAAGAVVHTERAGGQFGAFGVDQPQPAHGFGGCHSVASSVRVAWRSVIVLSFGGAA